MPKIRQAVEGPPLARDVDLACQSLEALKSQLTAILQVGGGERTLGLLSAAADDCPDAVLVTDRSARIVMVNGAAARLIGMSTRQLQTLTIWDITFGESQVNFEVLWKEFLRAGRQRGLYTLRHADGSTVQVAYCAEAQIVPQLQVSVLRALAGQASGR